MKFCEKCGREILDEAVVCPGCGCSINAANSSIAPAEAEKVEKPGIARCALGFAFLIPILGIIFGIIGIAKYNDKKLKKQCIIAIPLSIVMTIAWYFIAI
ncbi:MAG: zinc-ribbon domain-containing protein [Acutalibacteraceae bacterium]